MPSVECILRSALLSLSLQFFFYALFAYRPIFKCCLKHSRNEFATNFRLKSLKTRCRFADETMLDGAGFWSHWWPLIRLAISTDTGKILAGKFFFPFGSPRWGDICRDPSLYVDALVCKASKKFRDEFGYCDLSTHE